MLSVKRVQYLDEEGNTGHYIDHVNFTWNTGFDNQVLNQEDRTTLVNAFKEARKTTVDTLNPLSKQDGVKNSVFVKNLEAFAGIKSGMQSTAALRLYPEKEKSYNGVKVAGLNSEKEVKPFQVKDTYCFCPYIW